MMYLLGVVTGIVICIFVAVLLKKTEQTINRTIQQTKSKLQQKGSIIEPEAEELQDWIKEIEK